MAVTTIYDSAGSGTWLCPAGVYLVSLAETWGGGGGGSRGSGNTGGSAGGGGGYAAQANVAVTPGRRYPWTVGAGGPGGTGSGGNDGGQSFFSGDDLGISAAGGQAGSNGGQGGVGYGATAFTGGSGGSGGTLGGAGGGSSAGTAADGANGSNGATELGGPGGTAPAGGGDGGGGGSFEGQEAPSAGFGPGGGGGGGYYGQQNGADGADGQVRLTYNLAIQPQVPFFPAGYSPLHSDFDAWIQAPFSFLTSRVVFRAQQSNALALAAGQTLIPFNNILEDPFGGWNASSSQWVCPAGYTGLYSVTLTVSCESNSNNPVLQARIGINSQAFLYLLDRAWVPNGGPAGLASGSQPVQLYGGLDSVQGFAYLDGGFSGNVATNSYQRCQLTINWFSSLYSGFCLLPLPGSGARLCVQGASPARVGTVLGLVQVVGRQFMAVNTPVVPGGDSGLNPSPDVHLPGDGFKMARVAARVIAAEVVKVKSLRNGTDHVLVRPTVRPH